MRFGVTLHRQDVENGTRSERGSVMPIMLALMVVLITISLGVLSLSDRNYKNAEQDGQRVEAMNIAEAGVEHVLWRIRQTDDGTGHYGTGWSTPSDEQDKTVGNGQYYLVTPSNGLLEKNAQGYVKGVRMQGWVPSRTAANATVAEVYVEFNYTSSSPFTMGIITKGTQVYGGSFYTNSYNSVTGSLSTLTNKGDVGTLSQTSNAVNIGGNPYFHGNVNYPTGFPGVVKTPGTWWTQYNAIQGFTPPAIPDVTVPTSARSVNLNGNSRTWVVLKPACCNNAYSGPSGEDYLMFKDNIDGSDIYSMASDGLPYIPAGDYYITKTGTYSADVNNNHVLRFGPGTTRLYLQGNLNIANSGQISSIGKKPTEVFVYGTTGTTIASLTGDTPLYGGLYAPQAAVTIAGSSHIYGSMIANTGDFSGGGWIYYDEAMGTGGGSSSNGGYALKAWTQTQ